MKAVSLAVSIAMSCGAAMSQELGDTGSLIADDPFRLAGSSLTFGITQTSQPDEFTALGPRLGIGIATQIGAYGEIPLYLEWTGFVEPARGSSSQTVSQEAGPLLYTTGTSPVGTIDLTAFVDASGSTSNATVEITDSTGDSASIESTAFSPATPDTGISKFAVSKTDAGGIFSASTTNGGAGTASAYGAVFDDTGFLFLGTGNESETTVTTSIDEEISASSHTVFLSAGFPINDQWTVTPRVGPTFRRFDRKSTSRTIFDVDEGFELATALPNISLTETTSLKTNYYGAIVGADFTRQFREGWIFSLGAEAGLAAFSSRSTGSGAVNVADTNVAIPQDALALDGSSAIVRITGGLTQIKRGGPIVTLSAFLDFLSDAPFVASQMTTNPALDWNSSTASLTGNGESYRTYSIERKNMVSVGVSLSVVFLF